MQKEVIMIILLIIMADPCVDEQHAHVVYDDVPPPIPVIITVCKLVLCHGWIAVGLALNSREKQMDFLLIN